MLPATKLLQRPISLEILHKLGEGTPSSAVWKYFLWCTETPRPSGRLGPLTQKIRDLAPLLGCQFETDKVGNVVLRKPATKGFEHLPSVCIQAHLDMVCSKNSESAHNFDTDPITPRIEGEWLKASGTTLGADDGIGVAACLALMEEEGSFQHPQLECLLTVDEETDMSGAENVDPAILQSRFLINVDSEEENSICFGCAGGFERRFYLPVARKEPQTPGSQVLLKVKISGLSGGHTGAQIHEGLGNAIQLMARCLRSGTITHPGLLLVQLEAGTAINSVPRECSAVISVPASQGREIRDRLLAQFREIAEEYASIEKNAQISVEEQAAEQFEEELPCNAVSTMKIFDFLLTVPHGVIRMSPNVPGLVETSNALSIVKLKKEELFAHVFARSSSDSQMRLVADNFDSLARMSGATVSNDENMFPGWQPDPSSKALALVKAVHEQVLGKAPHVYAVHAGLECGLIKKRYPLMDCVSIGPEIRDAHTPDERLLIPSIPRFFALLKSSLEAFTRV